MQAIGGGMRRVGPLFTADLFPGLHEALMQLLRGLSTDDWTRPTVAGPWTVRDVVAHLVDGNVRQISFRRDGLSPVSPRRPIESHADLVRFIDELNGVWVDAFQRVSPRLLVELLDLTGPETARVFAALDPFEPALFGVAWAGETSSTNWFDTAREYTERWHHQQQIRDAVGAEPLAGREWLHPVLDTFLRGLPHAYRQTRAGEGAVVAFHITGEAGGRWGLRLEDGAWALYQGAPASFDCRVAMDQDAAWRLLTKGLPPSSARERMTIEGSPELAEPFARMLAIMG